MINTKSYSKEEIKENSVYSTKELCAIIGVVPLTISRYVTRGEITPIRLGRKNRFIGSEILRFLVKKQNREI